MYVRRNCCGVVNAVTLRCARATPVQKSMRPIKPPRLDLLLTYVRFLKLPCAVFRAIFFQLTSCHDWTRKYILETFLHPAIAKFPQPEKWWIHMVHLDPITVGLGTEIGVRAYGTHGIGEFQCFTIFYSVRWGESNQSDYTRTAVRYRICDMLENGHVDVILDCTGVFRAWKRQTIFSLTRYAIWNDLITELKPRGIMDVNTVVNLRLIFTCVIERRGWWMLRYCPTRSELSCSRAEYNTELSKNCVVQHDVFQMGSGTYTRGCLPEPMKNMFPMRRDAWYKAIRDFIDTIPCSPEIGPATRPREILFEE